MIQVFIASIVLIGIYKLVLPKDNVLDWWASAVFIAAPIIVGVLLTLALGVVGTNTIFASFYYLLYFFIPLYFFRSVEEYSWARSVKFALIVPVVAVAVDVLLYMSVTALSGQ